MAVGGGGGAPHTPSIGVRGGVGGGEAVSANEAALGGLDAPVALRAQALLCHTIENRAGAAEPSTGANPPRSRRDPRL